MLRRLVAKHRSTGADLPSGDPLPAHPGVAMEGYFWRFTLPDEGRAVIALCGVNDDGAGGNWATVGLGGHPGLTLAEGRPDGASADPARLGCTGGDGTFVAEPSRVRVDLGADFTLDARIEDPFGWPASRRFGGSGAFHAVPGLNQYWHPHLLGGRARGYAVLDGERVSLDGAQVYAEKNWGKGGFPDHWWWGQAQGFAQRDDVCVAFAGGEVTAGPLRGTVTSLVVRVGDEVLRMLLPVRAQTTDTTWSLRARTPRHVIEVEASAPLGAAHVLPVPLPRERRNVPGALEHLGGALRLEVRRRGRVLFAGESALAGLEHGGLARAKAEADRRAAVGDARTAR